MPIRPFEGAQKVAVVCLDVSNPVGGATPVDQNNCAQVPAGVDGITLPFHLIAAVTQTTRGELAVVDLTGGYVVDEDRSTPGINFIPVGTNPTDVAIPPDGAFTYVASASPSKPGIYAIDNTRLLGDSTAVRTPPLQLTDLTACSLPQPPLALAIAAVPNGSGVDGGVQASYAILVLLGEQGSSPAKVVAVDPTNFIQKTQAPGALPPCVIAGGLTLSGEVPASWLPGPPWPDGVPYVDGGVNLSGQLPPVGPASVCASAAPAPGADAGSLVDAGMPAMPVPDAGGPARAPLKTAEPETRRSMPRPTPPSPTPPSPKTPRSRTRARPSWRPPATARRTLRSR